MLPWFSGIVPSMGIPMKTSRCTTMWFKRCFFEVFNKRHGVAFETHPGGIQDHCKFCFLQDGPLPVMNGVTVRGSL